MAITDEHVRVARTYLGPRVADAVSRTSPASRGHLVDVARRFTVEENPARIALDDDAPVIDYGGVFIRTNPILPSR
jgi:hypothetical protein